MIEQEVHRTLARINGRAWGVAVGLAMGLGLLVATLLLVFKGGETVGPHLQMLGIFLPGYRVTVLGSFIGFVYMFVIGYAVGRLIAIIYNGITGKPR